VSANSCAPSIAPRPPRSWRRAGQHGSFGASRRQTTTYGYDPRNRLTSIDYSAAGTPDVAYAYDANGNRTSMADGTGTTTYTSDELGRLVSVTTPGPTTVGYRYDLDGHRTSLIYPGGTAVTYTFDAAGRLESLTDWASRSVAYTYFPDGALETATNPNGTVATYAYDNDRRTTGITHAAGSTTISDLAYSLDPLAESGYSRTPIQRSIPKIAVITVAA
jgi:YD repeat-containing protein